MRMFSTGLNERIDIPRVQGVKMNEKHAIYTPFSRKCTEMDAMINEYFQWFESPRKLYQAYENNTSNPTLSARR